MKEFDLAYQLMEAVRQTDEWERIWMEYPGVTEAKARLDAVLDKVPSELADELFYAIGGMDWANECACVLFGARLACSMAQAMADPAGFSAYAAGGKGAAR